MVVNPLPCADSNLLPEMSKEIISMALNNKRKRASDTDTVVDFNPKVKIAALEDVPTSAFARKTGSNNYTNKQRVLILSSRGITARYRHLMEDLKKLIPHH